MISYKPFFETLLKKNVTEYALIYKQGISANTIHRIKKGLPITTKTIDTLCFILDAKYKILLNTIKMNNKGNWHTTIRCQFFIAFRRENANKKRL